MKIIRFLPKEHCFEHHRGFYFKISDRVFCCWKCWIIYWFAEHD